MFSFFQDNKFYEDIGHIFLGMIPFVGWWRENKQWPPGDIVHFDAGSESHKSFAPLDAVKDSYRDFMGYAIGDAIRTAVIVGLLIWRW